VHFTIPGSQELPYDLAWRIHERAFWDGYQHAYEELLTHTSVETAPW